MRILLDDLAEALAECACCICFIGVDVHSCCELGANAADNVTEDGGTAFAVDLNGNNLLVLNAELLSISGGQVNVALCNDNAFSDLNFACRANDLAACGACNVTGLTNGSVYAQGAGIGEGNFNLGSGTSRAEDDNVSDGLLGADESYALFACELTGLGEVLLVGKGCAFAEKDLDVFFRKMHVTCAGFN